MRIGVVTTSILQRKIEKHLKKNVKTTHDIRLVIFRETLRDLDGYLDTSDLLKLTSTSLQVIRDDILEIIKGFRAVKVKVPLSPVSSLDGALEELRLARDTIQVALKMLNPNEEINDSKSKKFLAEMRAARKHIEKVLEY